MKITLAVLFLAGLTIYSKCTAVLSLPPSLIEHAASLERTQTPKSLPPDDNAKAGRAAEGSPASDEDDHRNEQAFGGGIHGDAIDSSLFYKNLKNLWQKNFEIKKRELNAFEDVIAAATAPDTRPQQTIDAIKNNKNVLKVPPSQQQVDNFHNNFVDTKSNANNLNLYPNEDAYGPQMLDDINVLPPFGDASAMADNNQAIYGGSIVPNDDDYEDFTSSTTLEDDESAAFLNSFLRPLNYWPIECQGKNGLNCPPEYYSALIADRNNAMEQHLQRDDNTMYSFDDTNDSHESSLPLNDDEIVLLLTAEQRLIKFLSWALAELYPFGKFYNVSEDSADAYDPSMYLWKTFNLSGRIEPPLFVEEPHYIIVRREYDGDEDKKKGGHHYHYDPFIPPRGRKHNLPDLDALLQRYETFVPNRGRRDKIKDIFKYDDVFYPNRGKRQMTPKTTDIRRNDRDAASPDIDDNINIKEKQQTKGENVSASLLPLQLRQQNQHPLAKTLQQINNLMAKMNRKLHQIQLKREQQQQQQQPHLAPTTFDEMMSKPTTRMSVAKRFKSMVNLLQQQRRHQQQPNSRRQSGKRYSKMVDNDSREATTSSPSSRIMATNRLHALRSMSIQQPLQRLQAAASAAAAATLMTQPKQQHTTTPTAVNGQNISPLRLYQQATGYKWQPLLPLPQQQYQQNQQQFDPLSWYKLQMLQHQYHLPQQQRTMRHPRLTVPQHLQQHINADFDNDDQQEQQLATPQERQLPLYATIDNTPMPIDNTMANDLKNLFNINLD